MRLSRFTFFKNARRAQFERWLGPICFWKKIDIFENAENGWKSTEATFGVKLIMSGLVVLGTLMKQ